MARIVVLTPRFPYPLLKGDQVRAYHHIRYLSRRHDVFLVALSDRPVEQSEREEIEQFCQRVEVVRISRMLSYVRAIYGFLVHGRSLNESYFQTSRFSNTVRKVMRTAQPEVVHCLTVRIARATSAISDAGTSIDLIDALSLNLERRVEQATAPVKWFWEFERTRVKTLEEEMLQKFQHAFVTSRVDRDHLKEFASESDVAVIPNGVDIDDFAFGSISDRESDLLVFTGNMSYEPNVEAVEYFVQSIFPKIKKRRPQVRFQIAGVHPAPSVQDLDRVDGVEVLGFVASIAEVLRRATMSVCPLRSGAGIQNKVLEAMATGTPVVASSLAVAGVGGSEAGKHYVVADKPEEFAQATLELLDDIERQKRLGKQARSFVEKNYGWESTVDELENFLGTKYT